MAATTSGTEHVGPAVGHGTANGAGSTAHEVDRLREALVHHLDDVASALATAAKPDGNLKDAVHATRKALRRARTLVDLVRELIPRSEWRASRDAFREARRSLGPARDRAVAPGVLATLAHNESVRAAAETVANAVATMGPDNGELRAHLAVTAAAGAEAIEIVRAAVPEHVDWASLVDGARTTYRAARRAYKDAKSDRRSYHAWRRRSKELGYQLQVLASCSGAQVESLHQELESATDMLGPVVDLIMVRDVIREHRDVLERDAKRALRDAVDATLYPLMKETRSATKGVFRRSPKGFAKHLRAAVEADTAPTS